MSIFGGYNFEPTHINALARFAIRAESNAAIDKALMKVYRREVRFAFMTPTTYGDRRILCAAEMLIELGIVKPCAALIRA